MLHSEQIMRRRYTLNRFPGAVYKRRKKVPLADKICGRRDLFSGSRHLAAGRSSAPHVIFNGLHGIDAAWQLVVPFSSYPYTAGHMLALLILDYYLGCLVVGSIAMLLSILIGNAVASAGVICVAVILDLFVALPPQHEVFLLTLLRI